MGVMSCSRNGCERIMCDTYIDSVGYICLDCEQEFKDKVKDKLPNPSKEGDIVEALKQFMETEKSSYASGNEVSIDEFFSAHRSKH